MTVFLRFSVPKTGYRTCVKCMCFVRFGGIIIFVLKARGFYPISHGLLASKLVEPLYEVVWCFSQISHQARVVSGRLQNDSSLDRRLSETEFPSLFFVLFSFV